MDIHGNYEGGGVCDECQHNTEGINCETCVFGYFRAEGVLPNATDPCQRKHHRISIYLQVGFPQCGNCIILPFFTACDCGDDPRYSGNCSPGGGQCECAEPFRGAEDCSACADGYYDYPECKPCDCFSNGTQ